MLLVIARVAGEVAKANASGEEYLEISENKMTGIQIKLTCPTAVCHTVPDFN